MVKLLTVNVGPALKVMLRVCAPVVAFDGIVKVAVSVPDEVLFT